MPTIRQLPPAVSVFSSDEIPISQGGSVHAVSVGTLLLAAQPVITVQSLSLLGRTSLGSGGPEQIDVGIGMNLSDGTVVATGADHATYPSTSSLSVGSDLVISNQGSQMLMPTEFLRGLFSAGQNVSIDDNGVISTSSVTSTPQPISLGSAIGALQVASSVSARDLVPLSRAGTAYTIPYSTLLNGLTIDQATPAGPAADSDTIWVAQATNVMGSQNFSAVWAWISKKIPTYKSPVIEITTNTNLDTTVHNGRILVCSQPVTLTPLLANMGSGFQCQVINVSNANVTLGTGFLTSNGSYAVEPKQTVLAQCIAYSGGTIVYASIPQKSVSVAAPGQVIQLTAPSIAATIIALSWQAPSSGGPPTAYSVQYRQTGATGWIYILSTIPTETSCQVTGLQASTSYDFEVQASNVNGMGTASQVLTLSTAAATQTPLPGQVSGLTAVVLSSTIIQLSWSAQTVANSTVTYTVQYRVAGASGWTSLAGGAAGTSYSAVGLAPATGYDFTVFAANVTGAGPISLVVSATTAAADSTSSAPGSVNGVTASSVTTTSISLSWQLPTGGGTPTSYTVQFRNAGSTVWTLVQLAGPATAYQLAGLQSATSYEVAVQASNSVGTGPASQSLIVATAQVPVPNQVSGVTAVATSSSNIQVSWASQTGPSAAVTYSIQYRSTGSTTWTSTVTAISATSYIVVGLQATTSYDFIVSGVNATGAGPVSPMVTAVTKSVGNSVSSITWNVGPTGTYTRASGAIGVNAHVSPSSAAVQFGFSTSNTTQPGAWTAAILVNSDLWGAYVPTPSTAGNWYAWVEGADGSSPTVFSSSFVVQ